MSRSFHNYEIVYFRTISMGSDKDEEILKLAFLLPNDVFCYWIKPSNPITSALLSKNFNFELHQGEVFYNGRKLPFVSLKDALEMFLGRLESLMKPVVLVTHSGEMEAMLLARSIKKSNMTIHFSRVIAGFPDSFLILKNKSSYLENIERFTLPALARDVLKKNYTQQFHESPYDMFMLKAVVDKITSKSELIENIKSYQQMIAECEEYLRRLAATRLTFGVPQQVAPGASSSKAEASSFGMDYSDGTQSSNYISDVSFNSRGDKKVINELVRIIKELDPPADQDWSGKYNRTLDEFNSFDGAQKSKYFSGASFTSQEEELLNEITELIQEGNSPFN